MARENFKRRHCKRESIDARHRGRNFRSSEEASVMEVERREVVIQVFNHGRKLKATLGGTKMSGTKPFSINRQRVMEAYDKVRNNRGSGGVDGISMSMFDKDYKNYLYKLWNQMSSGSYIPPPVRLMEIPKKDGGVRLLGIPTIADRIGQTVVKELLEV